MAENKEEIIESELRLEEEDFAEEFENCLTLVTEEAKKRTEIEKVSKEMNKKKQLKDDDAKEKEDDETVGLENHSLEKDCGTLKKYQIVDVKKVQQERDQARQQAMSDGRQGPAAPSWVDDTQPSGPNSRGNARNRMF